MFSRAFVVPFALSAESSMSADAIPFTSLSAASLHDRGRSVAVWKPSLVNWKVPPVSIVAVRGKKSLNAQR